MRNLTRNPDLKSSFALLRSAMVAGLTETQLLVFLAVWYETSDWGMPLMWLSNEQIAEMTNKDPTRCSTIKNQLVEMKVLIQKGWRIGINKNTAEWKSLKKSNPNAKANLLYDY